MAKADRKSSKRRPAGRAARSRRTPMLFTSRNYLLILLGVAAVIVGYLAMWLESEVDGFISLYLAPLLILGGYLEIIYAILWRPREEPVAEQA